MDWEQNNLPGYVKVSEISFVNETVGWLTGTADSLIQIFKTSDGGITWVLWTSFSGTSTHLYFINLNDGWLAVDGSLYQTNNGGQVWSHKGSFTEISDIFFLTQSLGWILSDIEIYKTTNGGAGWTITSIDSLLWESWRSLEEIKFVNPDVGWIRATLMGPNLLSGLVVKTTDGGETWVEQLNVGNSFGPYLTFTDIEPHDSLLCWAITSGSRVFRTTDGGNNWDNVSYVPWLRKINSVNGSLLYGAGNNGVLYRSGDGGLNWTSLSRGSTIELSDLSIVNDSVLVASGGDYLLKSTDGGNLWSEVDVALPVGLFWINTVWFTDNLNGWIGCSYGGGSGGIYRTTNGGLNWVNQTGTVDGANGIFFLNNVIGWFVSGGYIYRTTDSGSTWRIRRVLSDIWLTNIFFINPDSGWAGGYQGIYRTIDGGLSWHRTDSSDVQYIIDDLVFVNSITGWFVTEQPSRIFRTDDGGMSWVEQSHPLSIYSYPKSVYFETESEGWVAGSGFNGKILHTTDGGAHWNAMDIPAGNDLRHIEVDSNDNIWVVGDGGTIMSSDLGQIVNIEDTNHSANIHHYELFSNYPNPFNPSTTIIYSLPAPGFVTVKIFDGLGREVTTLVNETRQTGQYKETWNSAAFPSGVYFCRLQAGDYHYVIKMVLMK
ncbi:MAG TPA: T9SS type A sorting domain-containing protein [Bacteroidota bacterium]|nr:T9SS type A sorting domain-containing protein [Bacteroidota bacterium]